ncbi:MAG: prephenate dehydrogenase/arogenate dehydrogenase family protein [Proteobacteria bacterium]|nr:prephenate dehydrogenase/arogenate dehydrogenase family protein [Pseudomonadota bacterium]
MFGPDTELLSGQHVIFIDLGDAAALAEARALFGSTMADLVVMGLDEHDRLIAFVLGLSHALNIAFFTALAESGEAAPRLAHVEHDVRRAARRCDSRRGREPRPVFRDPEPERVRRGIAARLAGCGQSPVPLGP